jgi:hypothetical protein
MIDGAEKPPFVNPGQLAACYVLPIASPWFVVLFLLKEDPLLTLMAILIFLSTLYAKTGRYLLQGKYIFKYAVIISSLLHVFLGVAAFLGVKSALLLGALLVSFLMIITAQDRYDISIKCGFGE